MATFRRTLSLISRPGSVPSGEACLVASPLSRSSLSPSSFQTPVNLPPPPCFTWLDYGFYQVQGFVVGLFSQRSSRPLERQKPKRQVWKRSPLHFFLCFSIGVFYGFSPFASMTSPMTFLSKREAVSFKLVEVQPRNVTALLNSSYASENSKVVQNDTELGILKETQVEALVNQSLDVDLYNEVRKLLIIVTPTYDRPFQSSYLNRLAHTIKLIPPPLLWIVVDMETQSAETAKILRGNGVIYRHLVCDKNLSDVKDRSVHQRNVALSHIETHRLDGIVYFADVVNTYSVDIFESMRQIRGLGTWVVAKLVNSRKGAILEGPVCNGTQILGWHTNRASRQSRRFHAELSGFAFNSTMLWDQKRWNRRTTKPIRQLDIVRKSQVSTFIQQVVEDESQIECLPLDLSKIMVWNLDVLVKKKNLDVTVPLA